jgi:multiple sugar transport system permease protein
MANQSEVGTRVDQARLGARFIAHWQTRLGRWLKRGSLYLLLLALSLLFMLPFLWMISTSLKDDPQTYHIPPIWIPNPMRLQNYPEALTTLPFGRYFLNTLVIIIPSCVGVLAASTLAAYGFARIRWRGREAFFFICLATMMLPFQVQMIPLFVTFKQLGWINTYLPLIVPAFFGNAYFIFLLRQFFLTIPQELSDAARVDGCSELGIFVRIILPLARPALAVVVLFQFIWIWNDYLGPLIYLHDRAKFPIALALQLLRSSAQSVTRLVWPYLMAASTAAILPVLLLFFFTQRTFVEGISITGMKG